MQQIFHMCLTLLRFSMVVTQVIPFMNYYNWTQHCLELAIPFLYGLWPLQLTQQKINPGSVKFSLLIWNQFKMLGPPEKAMCFRYPTDPIKFTKVRIRKFLFLQQQQRDATTQKKIAMIDFMIRFDVFFLKTQTSTCTCISTCMCMHAHISYPY